MGEQTAKIIKQVRTKKVESPNMSIHERTLISGWGHIPLNTPNVKFNFDESVHHINQMH